MDCRSDCLRSVCRGYGSVGESVTEKRKYSFDDRCLELAEHFLMDEKDCDEDREYSLAQAIQDAVENWFAGNEK